MTQFDDYEIHESATAAATWMEIKEFMEIHQSVEVIYDESKGRLFLRVWPGQRRDGSNLDTANTNQDY
jgi:hypothetical protein